MEVEGAEGDGIGEVRYGNRALGAGTGREGRAGFGWSHAADMR